MDSEEDYYSGGDGEGEYDTAEDIIDDEEPYTEKHYTILKEETIKQLLQTNISEVSSVLAVSRGTSCSLLLRKNWCVSSVFEEWFADKERVLAAVGVSTQPKPKPKQTKEESKKYCKICMETVSLSRMLSTSCGHLFCSDCWTNYVGVSIENGSGCLTLCCPEPKCAAAVGLEMVEAMAAADDDYKRKLDEYIYRSYVESSRNRKWCPGRGCDRAVEMVGAAEELYDVACDCSHKFCWRCTEEQHRPVGCDTVVKWAEKNSSEAENTSWILAYTKACPKCNTKIEKNQGCSHMTCKCGCEFCWLCLAIYGVNGAHQCNTYQREEAEARNSRLEATRLELKRYGHYHERWASNHRSREIALRDAVLVRNKHLPELSRAQGMPETALQFVMEAWDQIVECRRVLKWSYTYGYYISKEEDAKKTFFEYLQGQAEAALERLHHCAEKEMVTFIKSDDPSVGFADFRVKLSDVTAVTRKYFRNLVRALESDLSEVKDDVAANVHDDHDIDVEYMNMLMWSLDYVL